MMPVRLRPRGQAIDLYLNTLVEVIPLAHKVALKCDTLRSLSRVVAQALGGEPTQGRIAANYASQTLEILITMGEQLEVLSRSDIRRLRR